MNTSTRERRDWTFLIFLIPIGIILMLIAGQCAVRLVPVWRVNAGMQSKLDPNNLSVQQNAPVQPISPAILTPLGWLDTFLTPGSGGSGNQNIVFPPFVVFEPTATPVVTASPTPTVATTQPSPTIPVTQTPTVVGTPSATRTPKPPVPTATTTVTATTTATATHTSDCDHNCDCNTSDATDNCNRDHNCDCNRQLQLQPQLQPQFQQDTLPRRLLGIL